MASRIEDYAIVGDTETVALVDRTGSIDWWCAPRIDSGACFAALLGKEEHGRWLLRPSQPVTDTTRRYLDDTLILETLFTTEAGKVAVIDFMPPRDESPTIYRIVEGRGGTVDVDLELVVRLDYGSIVPWVRPTGDGLTLVGGSDGLRFHSAVPIEHEGLCTRAKLTVREGQRLSFSLVWYPANVEPPLPYDAHAAFHRTLDWWRSWVGRCRYEGEWRPDVVRSLITLKALTFAPTGAIAAAATTSLPEQIGGVRNWDYRFSWLRDATFTLHSLLLCGYDAEAMAWATWLRRAVAGRPEEMQIMYGVGGERRLTELELPWLPGYEGSKPVRIGNEASDQFQLDVYGEVMDAALTGVREGLTARAGYGDEIVAGLMHHLEEVWDQPDDGIWEVRGPRRHFTHSKVMAWVAFDRAVQLAEHAGRSTPDVARWRTLRQQVHDQVCAKGWSDKRKSFVQSYGSDALDASLLMMATVGFLPPDDPRIVATVDAIQRDLVVDGFVKRYETDESGSVDGLPGGEGAFLMTTFWLADNLALAGRRDEALAIFERLRGLQNDVGLFSEEYDPTAKRMVGNFPQAFSHVAFINSAANLSSTVTGPAAQRAGAAPT